MTFKAFKYKTLDFAKAAFVRRRNPIINGEDELVELRSMASWLVVSFGEATVGARLLDQKALHGTVTKSSMKRNIFESFMVLNYSTLGV